MEERKDGNERKTKIRTVFTFYMEREVSQHIRKDMEELEMLAVKIFLWILIIAFILITIGLIVVVLKAGGINDDWEEENDSKGL